MLRVCCHAVWPLQLGIVDESFIGGNMIATATTHGSVALKLVVPPTPTEEDMRVTSVQDGGVLLIGDNPLLLQQLVTTGIRVERIASIAE